MNKELSFRDISLGGVAEIVDKEQLGCVKSQKVISYLMGAILDYKEEGISLNPSIIYCKGKDEFLKLLPGSSFYKIGESTIDLSGGKKILKECAALAKEGWHIIVDAVENNKIIYGIFTYNITPLSLPLEELLTNSDSYSALLIKKTSNSSVGITGSKGHNLSLIFSTTEKEGISSKEHIKTFCKNCAKDIDDDESDKEEFVQYLSHIIINILEDSHGTILLCGEKEKLLVSDGISDCIPLDPGLNFFESFKSYKQGKFADDVSRLKSLESLLAGLVSSDGMVAFDTAGNVFAYRLFYRPPQDAEPAPDAPPVGGARRRAFEGIKTLIGGGIEATLFRSQDGLTIYGGVDE